MDQREPTQSDIGLRRQRELPDRREITAEERKVREPALGFSYRWAALANCKKAAPCIGSHRVGENKEARTPGSDVGGLLADPVEGARWRKVQNFCSLLWLMLSSISKMSRAIRWAWPALMILSSSSTTLM